MEKSDAARKMRGLQALADDEGAPLPERGAARQAAARLREKYAVTDEDLALLEPALFFGSDLNFFRRDVEPHLEAAAVAIEKAMQAAERGTTPRDVVEAHCRIWQAVKHAAEETGYSPYMHRPRGPDGRTPTLQLKTRRNAAIKRYFHQATEANYESSLRIHLEVYGKPADDEEQVQLRVQAMDHAIRQVASAADLNQDVIERIVKHRSRYR